jgi:hypothetical protein
MARIIIEKPFVRRFWSDFKKAKEAAKLLFTLLKTKESVFIVSTKFGLYGTLRKEFSIRLKSEGLRIDSIAIKHCINYDNIQES